MLSKITGTAQGHEIDKQDTGHINPVQNRNFGLDLVRSIAIILVILSHFGKSSDFLGFWGVEMFFGLSGFLIGQILWRHYAVAKVWNLSEISNFWTRRWWRTLPNYYLFFIVSLFFHYFIMGKIPGIERLSEFLWFGQDLLNRNDDFYGVSWSLCIEEWFYLLFPLVLFCTSKIRITKQQTFLFAVLFICIACFCIRFSLFIHNHKILLRSITLARIDAIACGVFVAFIVSVIKPSDRMQYALYILGVAFLILSYFFTIKFKVQASIITLLLIPLGISLAFPLVSKIPRLPKKFNFLNLGVQNISLWSYSLYLCHIPILFTVYHFLSVYRDNLYINFLSKIIALAISVFVSAILFKYFELPLTKMRKPEAKS